MRGRNRLTSEAVAVLHRTYGRANRLVKDEIRKAKNCAWRELIATLDEDPWGLPYKLVLKKLKRSSPGLTMTLEPAVLERLLSELFPSGRELQSVCPTHNGLMTWVFRLRMLLGPCGKKETLTLHRDRMAL